MVFLYQLWTSCVFPFSVEDWEMKWSETYLWLKATFHTYIFYCNTVNIKISLLYLRRRIAVSVWGEELTPTKMAELLNTAKCLFCRSDNEIPSNIALLIYFNIPAELNRSLPTSLAFSLFLAIIVGANKGKNENRVF